MVESSAPIMIVEDSDEDYETTVWALRRAGVFNPCIRLTERRDIFAMLRREGVHSDPMAPVPVLVLLDLNLPRLNGRELLAAIRTDPACPLVPLVVLTTSSNPRDVSTCYRAGASGYLVKPVDLARFATMIRQCAEYWLQAVTLPL